MLNSEGRMISMPVSKATNNYTVFENLLRIQPLLLYKSLVLLAIVCYDLIVYTELPATGLSCNYGQPVKPVQC